MINIRTASDDSSVSRHLGFVLLIVASARYWNGSLKQMVGRQLLQNVS